jgi:hypothetical protein
MKLRLNRTQIYISGIFVIFFYLILNRTLLILDSNITRGVVVNEIKWGNGTAGETEGFFTAPIVQFKAGKTKITFRAETNTDFHPGEVVEVLYKKNNINEATIYSFTAFWLSPLLYCLLPILIFTALIYSFLNPASIVVVDFVGMFKKTSKENEGPRKLN